MAERRRIVWDFVANTRNLERGTRDASRDLGDLERKTGGVAGGLDSMGAAALTAGAAFGGMQLLKFSEDAGIAASKADLARDSLDELLPSADALRGRFDELRTSTGLSRGEFDQMLLPLGTLLTNMDIGEGRITGFMDSLLTRAGDMAAFRGDLSETDDIFAGFMSAMKGEFDTLEQYGIKINQAQVNQQGLRDTGKAHEKELDDQEKAFATLKLIIDQTAVSFGELDEAQGDSQDVTNDTTARVKDATEEWGRAYNDFKVVAADAIFGTSDALADMTEQGRLATGGHIEDLARMDEAYRAAMWADQVEADSARAGLSLESLADTAEETARRIANALSPEERVSRAVERLNTRDLPSAVRRAEGIEGFQTGGIVPGPTGRAQLAVVHGGEEVISAGRSGGGGGPSSLVLNIGVVGDPDSVASVVVDALDRWERLNGPRPSGLGYEG